MGCGCEEGDGAPSHAALGDLAPRASESRWRPSGKAHDSHVVKTSLMAFVAKGSQLKPESLCRSAARWDENDGLRHGGWEQHQNSPGRNGR